MTRIEHVVAATLAASGFVAAGCSDDPSSDRVLVLAASSLTEAFSAMETEFEAANPGVDVELSFGGSSTLRVQVEQGAPAAVVAFADSAPMIELAEADLVDDPVRFATNSIVLATPIDDPGSVDELADLSDPDRLVGICAAQVPCGRYAHDVFERAGLDASVDTEEPDVRALVGKLVAGELDAGLVYSTDVRAMPDRLREVPLPSGVEVRAEYPIAVVTDTPERLAAERFVEFVASAEGQAVMADAGFGSP